MRKYTDEEIQKYREIMGHHGGINDEDIELGLDLIGDELGITGTQNVPDTSHITDKAYNDLMEKNLRVPVLDNSVLKEIPVVPEVMTLEIRDENLDWRKPKLTRAEQIADMASWMTPAQKIEFQNEINQTISDFDAANPPDQYRVPKNAAFYKKPKIDMRFSSRYLGIPKESNGMSKADYAQLDRNNLTPNGCGSGRSSIVPDNTPHANYTDACNLHDTLYGVPGFSKERADQI